MAPRPLSLLLLIKKALKASQRTAMTKKKTSTMGFDFLKSAFMASTSSTCIFNNYSIAALKSKVLGEISSF